MTALRQRMLKDLRIRNYAPETRGATFARSPISLNTSTNRPTSLARRKIRRYQLFLLNEKRVKLSSYIQAICALRFFHQNTLHRRIEIDRISSDQAVKLLRTQWRVGSLHPLIKNSVKSYV
jgi:integrase/recombinase XerD